MISYNVFEVRLNKLIGAVVCEIDRLEKKIEEIPQNDPIVHKLEKAFIRGKIRGSEQVLHFIGTMCQD